MFSIVCVGSCVVCWFPLLGNCDSVSATIFLSPGIYSISGLYYSSINLYHNRISVLKYLHIILLWSVNIFNCCPNKIVQNSLRVLNIGSNYFSVTVYRICSPVILHMCEAMSFTSWLITAPSCKYLASLCISKLLLKSGYDNKLSWAPVSLMS